MKKIFFGGILFFSSLYFTQTVKELNFDSNVPDSENNYVAVPREEVGAGYGFGYVYFDESAGYTYRIIGSLIEENGKLKVIESYDQKVGFQNQRIENLGFKTAKIPLSMVKQLGYPAEPDWLKSYKSSASEHEKELNRASTMNGARFSNLALPKLQKLYNGNYKTPKLFFELAFAHNVLKDFAKAEKISSEAIKLKVSDDLVLKEHLFSLVNQSKITDAEKFIENNMKSYKNESYKAESIINLIAFSNHFKQKNVAKKWLGIFRKEIRSPQYNHHIEQLEQLINSNDSISK
jgi:hypothetical protein